MGSIAADPFPRTNGRTGVSTAVLRLQVGSVQYEGLYKIIHTSEGVMCASRAVETPSKYPPIPVCRVWRQIARSCLTVLGTYIYTIVRADLH